MLKNEPLASYYRPRKLRDLYGQDKVVGKDSWLVAAIVSDRVPSLILWGPPGSGKTTLASIIAKETKADFEELSATSSGIKDLKIIIERAKENKRLGLKTILFIDEIHRWNKAQQDALLPQVENGTIILIGATTENPSFAVNSALLSRSKVVILDSLSQESLQKIIKRVARDLKVSIKKDVISLMAIVANGDARKALNILESAVEISTTRKKEIDQTLIKDIINKPGLVYDKSGEEHYNIISAFHKSMRGGDADASIYYLGRMIEAGEDPLYVARRMIRFASEDIGLVNNSALMLVNSTYEACAKIGLPECSVNLAHCASYLAKSKKSVAVYLAYKEVKAEIEYSGNLKVPIHLRNAPTKLMKEIGYGKDYKYTPLEDDSTQEYLPEELKGRKFLKSEK
ncbi:MAG: replication-associated recombination protein A [Patescibacteria group bacterium]|jgi:putative ATPase|nr:replication-associated recombination protein A [Patescibacteria group bacterium]